MYKHNTKGRLTDGYMLTNYHYDLPVSPCEGFAPSTGFRKSCVSENMGKICQ